MNECDCSNFEQKLQAIRHFKLHIFWNGISFLPRYVERPLHPPASACILHCRGAKPAAAKPAASKADYSRPRQTIADQGRPWQTKAFWNPRCYQHLRCLYYCSINPAENNSTQWKACCSMPTSQDILISRRFNKPQFSQSEVVQHWIHHHHQPRRSPINAYPNFHIWVIKKQG